VCHLLHRIQLGCAGGGRSIGGMAAHAEFGGNVVSGDDI
jgi:hypothetical protein